MRAEVVVAGSGKQLNGWLERSLAKSQYDLRFQQMPPRTGWPKTNSDLFKGFFRSGTKAVILMDDLTELVDWTQVILRQEKGPVLWAVSHLDERIYRDLDMADVKGILTPDIDSVTASCSIKMAIASWQREAKYRRLADKALADLGNRKQIEKAKGILMDRFRLSESEAYDRIRREAMNRRKSMVQIAESILLLEGFENMSS